MTPEGRLLSPLLGSERGAQRGGKGWRNDVDHGALLQNQAVCSGCFGLMWQHCHQRHSSILPTKEWLKDSYCYYYCYIFTYLCWPNSILMFWIMPYVETIMLNHATKSRSYIHYSQSPSIVVWGGLAQTLQARGSGPVSTAQEKGSIALTVIPIRFWGVFNTVLSSTLTAVAIHLRATLTNRSELGGQMVQLWGMKNNLVPNVMFFNTPFIAGCSVDPLGNNVAFCVSPASPPSSLLPAQGNGWKISVPQK